MIIARNVLGFAYLDFAVYFSRVQRRRNLEHDIVGIELAVEIGLDVNRVFD